MNFKALRRACCRSATRRSTSGAVSRERLREPMLQTGLGARYLHGCEAVAPLKPSAQADAEGAVPRIVRRTEAPAGRRTRAAHAPE